MTTALTHRLTASPEQAEQARAAAEALANSGPQRWAGTNAGHSVELGPELSQILTTVVRALATGQSVVVTTLPEVITTTVAAEMLGISRPTLMKLVAAGELPAHKVGSHTRLKTPDVLDFRQARRLRQRAAALALLGMDEDLNEA